MNYTRKEELVKLSTLTIYRLLVKNMKHYPSKNRGGILKAIKEEFRDKAGLLPDTKEFNEERKKAEMGLAHMMLYKTKAEEMRTNYSLKPENLESLNPKGDDYIYF